MAVGVVVWGATLALSRISSVSSMVAVLAAPVAAWLFGLPAVATVLCVIAAIVIFQHRSNIARLRAGTEPRLGQK